MKAKLNKLVVALIENMHKRRRLVLALSCLVVFVTTYTLILPAFTLEKDEAVRQGGIDVPAAAENAEDTKSDAPKETAEEKSDKAAPGDGLVYESKDYSVAVTDKHNKLPASTRVEVSEISKDDKDQAEKYKELYDDALKAVQEEEGGSVVADLKFAKFYDISLLDGADAVEPSKAVDVKISYEKALQKELKIADPEKVRIIHFAEDEKTGEVTPEVLDSEAVEVTVDGKKLVDISFEAEAFSAYAVTYSDDINNNEEVAPAEDTEDGSSEETEEAAAEDSDTEGEAAGSEDAAKVKKMPRPRAVKNGEGTDELDHHKTLTPNLAENGEWDGTYTLSLDIVGKKTSEQSSITNKVDIILVLDMSSSMREDAGDGRTRYDTEIDAVKQLGQQLMAFNTASSPDTITMSVMTFGNLASDPQVLQVTTYADLLNGLNNIPMPPEGIITNGGQGTNWEDALSKANTIPTRSGATPIVAFLSDGMPTLRNTPDSPHPFESFFYRTVGAYGPGFESVEGSLISDQEVLDSLIRKCYDNAKDEAKAIVDDGKQFYSISVFQDVNFMENLAAYAYSGSDSGEYPADCYKAARNAAELADAFSNIFETASAAVQYENVKITDTLTVATKTSLEVAGHANDFKYYKNDEEWSGAPAASYENGKVDWDLSSLGALEDGVTYKVSFTVWPNQDAYDAIMKLNNGDATEEDIQRDYPAVYEHLTKEGDKYVIYSNGDAVVTYDKVTYVDDVQQERVSGELSYPRPTMETLEYKMKVAKIWKDSLYPDHRPDSITFNIREDNEQYKIVTLTAADVSPDNPDKWEAEIPISPGIISDKIIEGVRLNGGHEYTVVEADTSDYHYDFEPEVLIPMLENGEMHFLGDEDGDEALSGTNHMRGSMTVTKKVVDEEGNDISSDAEVADKDFTFRVTLFKPVGEGDFEEITGRTTADDDAVWYRLLDDQNEEIGSASVINSGDTFTLKAGHSLRLLNLPMGFKYKIEEVTASNPEGFVFDNEEYDSVSEYDGNKVVLEPDADGYCIAQPNTWQYVTVTNKKTSEPPEPPVETEITIKKVDENGNKLTGAKFVLIAVDENGSPYTVETPDGQQLDPDHYNSGMVEVDENGVLTFSNLTPGNYLLSEYVTPDGYGRVGGGTWYITVDSEGNASFQESMTGHEGIEADPDPESENTFIVENVKIPDYDPDPPKPDFENHKRIDAFRDGTENTDTDLDNTASPDEKTDLYRIYLDFTINSLQEPNGVDLLFVIDHSGSMNNTAYGGNAARAPAVERVLNGPNGNDGIIADFLDMNEHNTWAAVGFKGDSGLAYYFNPYHRDANAGRSHSENLSGGSWQTAPSSISLPNEGYSILTNYTAGFWRAEQMLFQDAVKNNGKKKVIIFISDGIPTLNIPNLGGTLANAGTANGSAYYADSIGGCMPQALEQFGYFVSDMRNNGYTFGENAEFYTIGFGDSILASNEGQQLLKDMIKSAYGGTAHDDQFVGINDPRTGYDPVEKMEQALSIIIGKTESYDHVVVEDKLSEYVNLYGAVDGDGDLSAASARVTMSPNPNTPTDPDSELVLYEDGAVTAAGSGILAGVTFDPATRTVSTTFVDDYKAQLDYTYTLSFDVRVNDEAYEYFATNDNTYGEQGDTDTDYGTNNTSSGKQGLFSNDEGKVTYTHNDDPTPTETEYDDPVIQIFNAPIKILKVDQSMQPVGGAKFNLYSSGYDPAKGPEDPDNAEFLLKEDLESTIKTLDDGSKEAEVTTDKLKHGTYWLVETDAPDNYFDLDGPIRIDVSVQSSETTGDQVIVKAYMNGTEIKNPYLITTSTGANDWVLKVENKQGYELPSAGGIGTTIFYILGSLLVIGSGIFLVARRRADSTH